jgi:O-acetyl-ADP-ribose deacetylase (regulator of RNase III)
VCGPSTGLGPDVRPDDSMSAPHSDDEYGRQVTTFCRDLNKLRREAGVGVKALLSIPTDPPIRLKRSQFYAVLRGAVANPPSWDLVRVLIKVCKSEADRNHRPLSVSVDEEYWRRRHNHLTDWTRGQRRRLGHALPPTAGIRRGNILTVQRTILRRLPRSRRQVGVVTSDIRHVRGADVWVNPENTNMEMARVLEPSVSAIIRYEGSRRDAGGRVVEDRIAAELEAKVSDLRPVGAGEVFVTGAGELSKSNGVRFVIHAAAVHGEPGGGFQQITQIGRCVSNALAAVEQLDFAGSPGRAGITVLFPLLGTGTGGGDVTSTARTLIHSAVNYLRSATTTRIETVLFLAYLDVELDACIAALDEVGDLVEVNNARVPKQRRPTSPDGDRRRSRRGSPG